MRILLFNTHNPYREAGAVSLDLFNQLKKRGHNVKLLVNSYHQDYEEGIICLESRFLYKRKILFEKILWRINKLKDFLRIQDRIKINPDYCFFQLDEKKSHFRTDFLLKKAGIKPDAIIILYAKGFLNTQNLFELSRKTSAQIIWLMYDMAALTGGCHYAWDCTGYQNNCGKCPGIFSDDPHDLTYRNLQFKKKFLNKTNIQIIAASGWQYEQAKKSTLFKDSPVHKILLSIDPAIFSPADKTEVRSRLGIANNKKVIFFGAVVLSQKRKGMSYLLESLKLLREKTEKNKILINDILLLIAGSHIDTIEKMLPYDFHYMGKLNNTDEIAMAYQASDLFLCPSIEDSGPMMINQSLMCGTPVVSFEMGVARDLVIQGQTGYMAKLKDSNDLAEGLYQILSLDSREHNRLSGNCRKIALELCSPEVQINKIEEIFGL